MASGPCDHGAVFARSSPPGGPWARDPGFGDPGGWSGGHARRRGVRERVVKLTARTDAELAEDVAQVPLNGAGADEQLRADLGIRAPIARQAGDLRLLRGELVARLHRALTDRLARGQQLAARALGERCSAHRGEHLVRHAQLLARIDPTLFAAQPFAVDEPHASEVDHATAAREPLNGLAIEGLRRSS